jgi:hypothetical protein
MLPTQSSGSLRLCRRHCGKAPPSRRGVLPSSLRPRHRIALGRSHRIGVGIIPALLYGAAAGRAKEKPQALGPPGRSTVFAPPRPSEAYLQ